ncbi:uncharacterized protein LOC110179429 [Drosophila serrata]|uniref:uncharacterized protein LOC110179429 n=1 Tax=Drosophila serrata TaxID=7274 RepID=UPI000A1D1F7A|nr:uncharacterized protein LOC110179429 [Drosophila serrata]
MLKWTASAQRLNEMQLDQDAAEGRQRRRQQRRHRRATIANKENVPDYGYTSTPLVVMSPLPGVSRLRNSPLVLAPLSDIRNVTPEAVAPTVTQRVQSVRYATTLPRFAEDYSPNGVLMPGQHLALRGLAPLDPFLGQPQRYMAATGLRETKRKLDADLVATMEEQPKATSAPVPTPSPVPAPPTVRPTTPQPASTQMGDQTLDRLIDAILDSACKADASAKKKPRRCRSTFNLRRRTLVKQQLDADCGGRPEVLSPSYAPGDDPASDLSFGMMPMMPLTMTTPEPASPLVRIPHQVLVQLPTPKVTVAQEKLGVGDNTFCLETPVRSLKRSRVAAKEEVAKESPLKRYKVDERNYFEVGLALPSSIYV